MYLLGSEGEVVVLMICLGLLVEHATKGVCFIHFSFNNAIKLLVSSTWYIGHRKEEEKTFFACDDLNTAV